MSRVLVISDVHLKTKLFKEADEILSDGKADFAVQLGDILDDWGEEYNIRLYMRTMQAAIDFHKAHPNTLWCMGNHDFGYYHPDYGRRESGHSKFVEDVVSDYLKKFKEVGIEQKIIHIVDNVIFSHAGVMANWVTRQKELAECNFDLTKERLLRLVNNAASEELWQENSPLWIRPQPNYDDCCGGLLAGFSQVVGHSPVKKPNAVLFHGGHDQLFSCDTFSTYPCGAPYGSQSWVIIDTEKEEMVEEEELCEK